MVDRQEARALLAEAHEFVNGDPDDRVQDYFLARTETEELDDDADSDEVEEETRLAIGKIPLHSNIQTELNAIFVEELFKEVAAVVRNQEKPISRYDASNIEEEPTPLQFLEVEEIPEYNIFEPFTAGESFNETDFSSFPSPDFQALRIRDRLTQDWFLGFRKFTKRQVVGSSWKVKLLLRNNEYDIFEDDLYALPETFDAFYYAGVLFVKNQGRAEDIFQYFQEYRERADAVFQGIEDSDFKIHNLDDFRNAVYRDRSALRKMVEVERRGLYNRLEPSVVERYIDEYDINLEVAERDGEWGIILPSIGDKNELISLLNDDHLYSELTETKYQARGKEQRG